MFYRWPQARSKNLQSGKNDMERVYIFGYFRSKMEKQADTTGYNEIWTKFIISLYTDLTWDIYDKAKEEVNEGK